MFESSLFRILICLIIIVFVSNAVMTLIGRRDKSPPFSRVIIIGLAFANVLAVNSLYIKPLEKGIGVYGGLFNVTTYTQTLTVISFSMVIILLIAIEYCRKLVISWDDTAIYIRNNKLFFSTCAKGIVCCVVLGIQISLTILKYLHIDPRFLLPVFLISLGFGPVLIEYPSSTFLHSPNSSPTRYLSSIAHYNQEELVEKVSYCNRRTYNNRKTYNNNILTDWFGNKIIDNKLNKLDPFLFDKFDKDVFLTQ